MITFVPHEDLDCPVFLCDACCRQITENGWVLWTRDDGDHGRIWHVHRGWCDHQITQLVKATEMHVYSRELDKWLASLVYNTANPIP